MPRPCFVVLSAAALLLCAVAAPAREVYHNDFQRPDGLERHWSPARRDVTPRGGRIFLGRFHNETVTLTLDGLPDHKYVKISFELFLMINWHGNHEASNSLWQLALEGGPALVSASFSLWPDIEGYRQSYPANHLLGDAPAYTGAAESNTLGFKYDDRWGVRDAVYKMSFVVPHAAARARFHFAALGLPASAPVDKPGWGLDNVVVEALDRREATGLEKKELEQAWENLAAADAAKGSAAVRALAGAEDQAVAFLADKLGPAPDADALKKLIARLDSNEFDEREEATRQLTALGWWARPALEEALAAGKPPLEVRQRIEQVLKAVGPGSAVHRRQHQAAHVLELIGTAAARQLLDRARPAPR